MAALPALSVVFFLGLVAVLKTRIIMCHTRMTLSDHCVFKDIQRVVIFLLLVLLREFDVDCFIFEIMLGKNICDVDALSRSLPLSVDVLGALGSRFQNRVLVREHLLAHELVQLGEVLMDPDCLGYLIILFFDLMLEMLPLLRLDELSYLTLFVGDGRRGLCFGNFICRLQVVQLMKVLKA